MSGRRQCGCNGMRLGRITVIAFFKFVSVSLFEAIKRANFKKQDLPRGIKILCREMVERRAAKRKT